MNCIVFASTSFSFQKTLNSIDLLCENLLRYIQLRYDVFHVSDYGSIHQNAHNEDNDVENALQFRHRGNIAISRSSQDRYCPVHGVDSLC